MGNTGSRGTSGRRQWHPTPVLLPGKSHGRRSLVGCGPWGREKSQTRLSDFTFTFHFHALEKEMATRSSVLAWRIPGTGEPGGLPSMGSHRVGHDWSNLAAAAEEQVRWRLKKQSDEFCGKIYRQMFCFYQQINGGGAGLRPLWNRGIWTCLAIRWH